MTPKQGMFRRHVLDIIATLQVPLDILYAGGFADA